MLKYKMMSNLKIAVSLSSQKRGNDFVPFAIWPERTFCKPSICTVQSRISGTVISSGGKLHNITTTPSKGNKIKSVLFLFSIFSHNLRIYLIGNQFSEKKSIPFRSSMDASLGISILSVDSTMPMSASKWLTMCCWHWVHTLSIVLAATWDKSGLGNPLHMKLSEPSV